MLKLNTPIVCAALVAATISASAFADTVLMDDGDKLTGTIDKVTADTVEMTTRHAGHVSIKRASVKSMWSEKAIDVETAEGVRKVYVSPAKEGQGWVEGPVATATPVVVPVVLKTPDAARPVVDLERYYLPIGPHWKNVVTLGLTNTTGNTESTAFAAEWASGYKNTPIDFAMRFGGEYGVTEGTANAERFYNDTVLKRELPEWHHPRWFAFAESHNLYDGIKGISFRSQDAVGLGYRLFEGEKFKADLRAGPGITYEKFFNGEKHCDFSGLAGFHAEYIINERAKATEDIIYTNGLSHLERWQLSSETALTYAMPELMKGAGIKFLFRDDYDATTKRPAKHNDTRLVIGLTLEF